MRIALLAIYRNRKWRFKQVTALPNPLPTTQCQGGPKVRSIKVLISMHHLIFTLCEKVVLFDGILLHVDEQVCDECESLLFHQLVHIVALDLNPSVTHSVHPDSNIYIDDIHSCIYLIQQLQHQPCLVKKCQRHGPGMALGGILINNINMKIVRTKIQSVLERLFTFQKAQWELGKIDQKTIAKGLIIKDTILIRKIDLPLRVASGAIEQITINNPKPNDLFEIKSRVQLTIDCFTITLVPDRRLQGQQIKDSAESRIQQMKKYHKRFTEMMVAGQANKKPVKAVPPKQPNYFERVLIQNEGKIVDNIHIIIKNINIRYQDQLHPEWSFACTIDKLELFSCDSQGSKCFFNRLNCKKNSDYLRRVILENFSIHWNPNQQKKQELQELISTTFQAILNFNSENCLVETSFNFKQRLFISAKHQQLLQILQRFVTIQSNYNNYRQFVNTMQSYFQGDSASEQKLEKLQDILYILGRNNLSNRIELHLKQCANQQQINKIEIGNSIDLKRITLFFSQAQLNVQQTFGASLQKVNATIQLKSEGIENTIKWQKLALFTDTGPQAKPSLQQTQGQLTITANGIQMQISKVAINLQQNLLLFPIITQYLKILSQRGPSKRPFLKTHFKTVTVSYYSKKNDYFLECQGEYILIWDQELINKNGLEITSKSNKKYVKDCTLYFGTMKDTKVFEKKQLLKPMEIQINNIVYSLQKKGVQIWYDQWKCLTEKIYITVSLNDVSFVIQLIKKLKAKMQQPISKQKDRFGQTQINRRTTMKAIIPFIHILVVDDSHNDIQPIFRLTLDQIEPAYSQRHRHAEIIMVPIFLLEYYNVRSLRWEPFVEQFKTIISYKRHKGETQIKLEQQDSLKINLSTPIISYIQAAMKPKGHPLCVIDWAEWKNIQDSPFIFHNLTNQTISIIQGSQIQNLRSLFKGRVCIPDQKWVMFKIGGRFHKVNTDYNGVLRIPDLNYFVEFYIQQNKRVVKLFATILLHNNLKQPIFIKRLDSFSKREVQVQVDANQWFPLDKVEKFFIMLLKEHKYKLSNINNHSNYNEDQSEYSYSQEVITDKLKQEHSIIGQHRNFQILAHYQRRLNKYDIISLQPPFIIYNCLPKDLTVQFIEQAKLLSVKQIKSQDSRFVHANKNIEHLQFKVKVGGYTWSHRLTYRSAKDNAECQFQVCDMLGNEVTLNYLFKKNMHSGQYSLLIYCKAFVVNQTDHRFIIEDLPEIEEKSKGRSHSKNINEDLMARQNIFLLGPKTKYIRVWTSQRKQNEKYIIKTEQMGSFQQTIQADSPYKGQIKQLYTEIAVDISSCKISQNIVCKKIVLKDKYIFVNSTERDFIILDRFTDIEYQSKSESKLSLLFDQTRNTYILKIKDQQVGQKIHLHLHKASCFKCRIWKQSQAQQVYFKIFPIHHKSYVFFQLTQIKQSEFFFQNSMNQNALSYMSHNQNDFFQDQPHDISKTQINLPQVILSYNHNSPQVQFPFEWLVLSIQRLHLRTISQQKIQKCHLKIGFFQLDQMYPYIMSSPVIVTPLKCKEFIDSSRSIFSFSFVFNQEFPSYALIEEVQIHMQDLAVNLSAENISTAMLVFKDTQRLETKEQSVRECWSKMEIPPQENTLFIRSINISPFLVDLSVQINMKKLNTNYNIFVTTLASTLGLILSSFENAPVRMEKIAINECVGTVQAIASKILLHYLNSCAKQSLKMVGSLNILGNPCNLLRNVSTGVKDLVILPAEGFNSGPSSFGCGVVKGTGSLILHSVGGVFNSVSKATSAVSNGLSALAFDQQFEQLRERQKMRKPKNILQGIEKGGIALLHGIKEGITGLFIQPYEYARKEGALGFIKGTAKGLAGLIIKPITGVIDFASKTTEGIKNNLLMFVDRPQDRRMRYPRVFYTQCQILKEYSYEDSKLFHIINQGHQKSKQRPIFMSSSEYKKGKFIVILQSSVLFIKIKAQRIQWSVDYSQLDLSKNNLKQSIIFRKKNSSCDFFLMNQYQVVIKQDNIRQFIVQLIQSLQRKHPQFEY